MDSQDYFSPIIDHFTNESREEIAVFLSGNVSSKDFDAFHRAACNALFSDAKSALVRVILLELHAEKIEGQLVGIREEQQFASFLALFTTKDFLAHIDRRYPMLLGGLDGVLKNRVKSIKGMIARLNMDRGAIRNLLGVTCEQVEEVHLGLGDMHNGGQAVSKIIFTDGAILYKPRSVRLDVEMNSFLKRVFPENADRIFVPRALDCGEYGWTEFIPHVHCKNQDEMSAFYLNIGRWIAIMHLLGGTDIHYENLIASGVFPVIVDIESLFAREVPDEASGHGRAYDAATTFLASSVLRTGIIPYRLSTLAFKGMDISAIGAMPQHQPDGRVPVLINEGTMDVRLSEAFIKPSRALNHPCDHPNAFDFRDKIIRAFHETTLLLQDMDQRGDLEGMLRVFEGSYAREILRPTQLYVEMMRMLWHPASLHDGEMARARVRDLLVRGADMLGLELDQIEYEIDSLLQRDIPIFGGVLTSERIMLVLDRWRASRVELQELVLRGAFLTLDLNRRLHDSPGSVSIVRDVKRMPIDSLEEKRRQLAERAVRKLVDSAVHGDDGTTTWISPILSSDGWIMQPVGNDLYTGLCGIGFALACYENEVRQGRVSRVDGVSRVLEGALLMLQVEGENFDKPVQAGFIGSGGQIFALLSIYGRLRRNDILDMAIGEAEKLRHINFGDYREYEILEGLSGLIVPLLHLADTTKDPSWFDLATKIGKHLEVVAVVDNDIAYWPTSTFDRPIGGFSHGATGIGWALARLAMSGAGTDDLRERWGALALKAFAFEQTLYDPGCGQWRDLRVSEEAMYSHAWCHGSVGIGLCAADLYSRNGSEIYRHTLQLAVASAGRRGWRNDVSLCHGSLGMREMLWRAQMNDKKSNYELFHEYDSLILESVEQAMDKESLLESFAPGLMTGVAGIVYGLSCIHPEYKSTSPLLMECGL